MCIYPDKEKCLGCHLSSCKCIHPPSFCQLVFPQIVSLLLWSFFNLFLIFWKFQIIPFSLQCALLSSPPFLSFPLICSPLLTSPPLAIDGCPAQLPAWPLRIMNSCRQHSSHTSLDSQNEFQKHLPKLWRLCHCVIDLGSIKCVRLSLHMSMCVHY